jgi:hypothetical protein
MGMLLAARGIAGAYFGDLWLLPCLSLIDGSIVRLRPALRLLTISRISCDGLRALVDFMMRRVLLVTLRVL